MFRTGRTSWKIVSGFNQDGLTTAFMIGFNRLFIFNYFNFLVCRPLYLEGRTLPGLAITKNIPVMSLHYAVGRGQAKTRALTHFFGGEEWVKNMLQGFLVHTATRV